MFFERITAGGIGFVAIVLSIFCFLDLPSSPKKMSAQKNQWPELVGMAGEEAKAKILEDCSNIEVQILPQDSMMTMDFREDRVRILVDDNGKVVQPPRRG